MIVINSSDRRLNVPGADFVFGVEADARSETKYFQCPRYVGNDLDLTSCFVRINYRNANGDIDSYLVDDVAIDGDNVTFSWVLSPKVVMYKGQIKFVVCVVGPDTKVKWHTTLGTGKVLEGLEPDNSLVEEGTADVVAALIAMVEAQTVAVEAEGANQIKAVKAAAEAAEAAAVAEIEAKGVNTRNSIPSDYTATVNALRGCAGAIVCEAEGEVITLSDSSNLPMQGLRIFGRSTQDGTPTPEAPVEIVSVENPMVTVTDGAEGNVQNLSIPRVIPGIPVVSGGNYTDANGQQWICDEADLERGVYVQRIGARELNGAEGWALYSADGIQQFYMHDMPDIISNTAHAVVMCEHYRAIALENRKDNYGSIYSTVGGVCVNTLECETVTEWKALLHSRPLEVQYILATPIETPLSETEIAAYRALHTNKPNTTILNDSGAHMAVAYTADTKLYIDNKIKEALQ